MPNLLDKATIQTIHESAKDILTTIGVEFDLNSARELFKKNGAKVDGKKVYFPISFLEQHLDFLCPKRGLSPGAQLDHRLAYRIGGALRRGFRAAALLVQAIRPQILEAGDPFVAGFSADLVHAA